MIAGVVLGITRSLKHSFWDIPGSEKPPPAPPQLSCFRKLAIRDGVVGVGVRSGVRVGMRGSVNSARRGRSRCRD